ncbi:unnamed protein product, partial [Discosporangium mesarthrocarpum]
MDKNTWEALKFRRRFRVPFPFFEELVKEVESQGWLGPETADASDRPGIPLQLKVLAVLQILGRGNCLDDIQQLSGMSQSRAQSTFHHFCECFARDMYAKWIYVPEGNDLKDVMPMYEFLGAVGSTDVTHVRWERAPIPEGVHYMGKERFVAVMYQLTVDHTGFARGVTAGFPGARNGKTIMQYDGTIRNIRHDPKYTQLEYKLVDYEYEGNKYTEKGTHIIVDGGYHKSFPTWSIRLRWRCTICPFKASITQAQAKWNKRPESVCKDVKCFFDRTKGRWRVLK